MDLGLAETYGLLLLAADLAAAAWATGHIVLRKDDWRAAIGWVGLVWLAPIIGALLYFAFGINRIERAATVIALKKKWRHPADVELTSIDEDQLARFREEYPALAGLALLGRKLTGRTVTPGNRVEPLIDGDETYPAMIAAIDEATRTVNLLSYIFDADAAGEAVMEALVRAQRRGVAVRVLIDDVGSRYSRPTMVRRLRSAGLRAETFLPTRVPRLFKYANLRNHRKILVVDGAVGFTGGTNIRAGHWLSQRPASPVQCLHFRLAGPVVAHLQETFAVDWAFATEESLSGPEYFPPLERTGDVWARGVSDGPDEDYEKMPLTIHGALDAARRSVRIVTPYFLPDRELIHALAVAALRGVDVEILLPVKSNIRLVQWATTALLPPLLERGCRVYLTNPPFDHTKLMLVDELWSLVGSTNWDARSLRLNFEFNVECYSSALATRLARLVEGKRAGALEVTAESLRLRPLAVRLRDGLARLPAPYL